jgi:hypothetical protein
MSQSSLGNLAFEHKSPTPHCLLVHLLVSFHVPEVPCLTSTVIPMDVRHSSQAHRPRSVFPSEALVGMYWSGGQSAARDQSYLSHPEGWSLERTSATS